MNDNEHTPAEALAAAIVDMINVQYVHYADWQQEQLERFDKLVRAIERAMSKPKNVT